MTSPSDTSHGEPRKPRAFSIDDPNLVVPPPPPEPQPTAPGGASAPRGAELRTLSEAVADGFRWGQLLLSAAITLAVLATGVWFTRFVSVALARDDLFGWIAWGLFSIIALAIVVLACRELIGIFRLSRLGSLRRDADRARAESDPKLERAVVKRLSSLLSGRPELRWGQSRLGDHMGDVRDAGDLMRLGERELLVPIDAVARTAILKSAKRVATVTAISPMAWVAMLFVLIENLRMLRQLAALYGGRPGFLGGIRLARSVIAHIIATGGIALTDDLLGQFLGQDVLRRISSRLGEGVFNGTLTARVGVAALDVIRPLPFIDAPVIRVRDLVPELVRRKKGEAEPQA